MHRFHPPCLVAPLSLALVLAVASPAPLAMAQAPEQSFSTGAFTPLDHSWESTVSYAVPDRYKSDAGNAPSPRNADIGKTGNGSPAVERKLQLQGAGLKYRVNKRLTIESGFRLGLAPSNPVGELPASGARGAYIRLQRSFGPR